MIAEMPRPALTGRGISAIHARPIFFAQRRGEGPVERRCTRERQAKWNSGIAFIESARENGSCPVNIHEQHSMPGTVGRGVSDQPSGLPQSPAASKWRVLQRGAGMEHVHVEPRDPVRLTFSGGRRVELRAFGTQSGPNVLGWGVPTKEPLCHRYLRAQMWTEVLPFAEFFRF